jgi:hypothetical protein
MTRRSLIIAAAVTGVAFVMTSHVGAHGLGAKDLKSLKVLYVGDPDTPRGKSIEELIRPSVSEYAAAKRDTFEPKSAAAYDVVVLDWPQDSANFRIPNFAAPLGKREDWGRPTVLLGSAGLNLAVAWQVRGGSGCTCMDPLAYGLREHEIFEKPGRIDRDKMVSIPTPKDFQEEIKDPTVRVLPLVRDYVRNWPAGWCTYAYDFDAHPDVEYFSGGVNHKTPTAAGLWRQGNLLHFGFEQSPAEMNETGRQLLLNSIAYISRFSQDRPIAYTPSVFGGKAAPARASVMRWLKGADYNPQEVAHLLAPGLLDHLKAKDRGAVEEWAKSETKWLHPNADVLLEIDEDLRSLGVTFDSQEFLDALARLLGGTDHDQALARRLAERYVPELKDGGTAWLKDNRPYLFASDTGDYRWYVDPLAKKYGVPSERLRGASRADNAIHVIGSATGAAR